MTLVLNSISYGKVVDIQYNEVLHIQQTRFWRARIWNQEIQASQKIDTAEGN